MIFSVIWEFWFPIFFFKFVTYLLSDDFIYELFNCYLKIHLIFKIRVLFQVFCEFLINNLTVRAIFENQYFCINIEAFIFLCLTFSKSCVLLFDWIANTFSLLKLFKAFFEFKIFLCLIFWSMLTRAIFYDLLRKKSQNIFFFIFIIIT